MGKLHEGAPAPAQNQAHHQAQDQDQSTATATAPGPAPVPVGAPAPGLVPDGLNHFPGSHFVGQEWNPGLPRGRCWHQLRAIPCRCCGIDASLDTTRVGLPEKVATLKREPFVFAPMSSACRMDQEQDPMSK